MRAAPCSRKANTAGRSTGNRLSAPSRSSAPPAETEETKTSTGACCGFSTACRGTLTSRGTAVGVVHSPRGDERVRRIRHSSAGTAASPARPTRKSRRSTLVLCRKSRNRKLQSADREAAGSHLPSRIGTVSASTDRPHYIVIYTRNFKSWLV
jgi:hypothetical protein